jgi:single-strand DNA-binding protein
MNRIHLVGRLARDPEMRSLASGKNVTTFTVATTDALGGAAKTEYHSVVTWVWRPHGRTFHVIQRTVPPLE